MMGEAIMRLPHSAGPASTGQVPVLTHPAANPAAHSGGSVRDRNVPASAPMIVCAEISACRSPSGLTRGGTRGAVRFSTRTRSRSTP